MTIDIADRIRRHGFKRLLLAVSGGLDSICLAHYFIKNRETFGIEWLGIAHVHHGLREGTADRDAAFVEAFAKSHGVPFFLKKLDGEALKAAEGSLEENARDARYKALMDTLATTWSQRDEAAIVTAHHAGDQAETMLMRLRRGTTLAGLRGIQELRPQETHVTLESCKADRVHDNSFMNPIGASPLQDDRSSRSFDCAQDDKPITTSPIAQSVATSKCHRHDLTPHTPPSFFFRHSSFVYLYRPFLNVTRSELLAYAHEHNLTWCEDESNADVKFARNKIRHVFLPHLEENCPGATQQLCRIAEIADKVYETVLNRSNALFSVTMEACKTDRVQGDNSCEDKQKTDPGTVSGMTCIKLNKKKLNKILLAHKDADLSELFRLWLSELGFRFPTGFFYAPKEPAHVKIPIRASYRKRSIVKIRHTVWICEFKDTESALKFVSCEMKEKGLYE